MPIWIPQLRNGTYVRAGMFERSGAMVALIKSCMKDDCPPHTHDFEELVIVTAGRGYHVVDGNDFAIAAGDVFLICNGRSHGYRAARNLEIVNLGYDRRELLASAGDLGDCPGFHVLFSLEPLVLGQSGYGARLRLSPRQLRNAIEQTERIEEELLAERPGFRTACRALFLELALTLSRLYTGRDEPADELLWRMGEVLSFLEKNFAAPIAMPKLAQQCHLSVRQFYRSFQKATGLPPLVYLLRLRIEHAQRLLEQTALPVAEIAVRSGFCDGNYFARQFRRIAGFTPLAYRKMLGKTAGSAQVPE